MNVKSWVDKYLWYTLIGLVSFVTLVFLPFMGSTVGMAWVLPNTTVGWIVFIVCRLIISALNMFIFYSFKQQAKINIKDHPDYIKAEQILKKTRINTKIPMSPEEWNRRQYVFKGGMVFICSIITCVALTQAILAFEFATFLSYLFTIGCGVVFGLIHMKQDESWWTHEYLEYALYEEEQNEKLYNFES